MPVSRQTDKNRGRLMKFEDQVRCIEETLNNTQLYFESDDISTFRSKASDPFFRSAAANLYDELDSKGVKFGVYFKNTDNFEVRAQVIRVVAAALLHADEKQGARLVDNVGSFKFIKKELGLGDENSIIYISLDDLIYVKKSGDILRLFNDFCQVQDQDWINTSIIHDDAELAMSLISPPNSILYKFELRNSLGDNPNIQKALFGTTNNTLKDVFLTCLMPFTFQFDELIFARKFEAAKKSELFSKYSEQIMLHCFQELKRNIARNSYGLLDVHQTKAMIEVFKALVDVGVDWYKPWQASKEVDSFPALIDLADLQISERDKVLNLLNDEPFRKTPDYPIAIQGRRAIISLLNTEAVCDVVAQMENPDYWYDLFYRETQNIIYLERIQSTQAKRKILADDFSL
jgi:hypothetical protein